MELKQRIEIAKVNLKKAETAKIQAEAEKSSAEKQLQECFIFTLQKNYF